MSTTIVSRLATAAATTVIAAIGAVGAFAPAAHAAAPCSQTSCAYNYNASQVPTWCWSGCQPGTIGINNGTKVSMSCYWDADPYTGNYRSNRYFAVLIVPLAGRRLVHSSYVYNQTSVGAC